jgi:uncharacterized protein with von Willebrand factor type A (vWA) domain
VSALLPNLLHFSRLLRSLGLDVPAARMIDVAGALTHVEILRRSDFYFTLRTLLVHRVQDLPVFDDAFRVFWRRPPGDWTEEDLRALGEERRSGPPQVESPAADQRGGGDEILPIAAEPVTATAPQTYSGREALREKDFARFTEEELREARALIASLDWKLGLRRTRRWSPAPAGAVDIRRVVRRNLRYGGEPVILPARARAVRRRPIVILCDVSGSMERYDRMLLHFIHSLSAGLGRVEAFLFATRLTWITRQLARKGADEAVTGILRQVPDWSGGTRIGESLRAFNVRWARRVLGHGPVVLLVSDGWDRGEPGVLAREMARLQRSCHRLIWLNPLLGSPDYQPLTRGMQAALPFVDDFLPVHNLDSLAALAAHLGAIPSRRSPRRRRLDVN